MKRRWLALIFLLLLAGAVVFFWRSDETSIGRTVTFSDGTTFTLKDVTYGTEHRLRGGGLRERLIALLPRKLARKYASRQAVMTSTRPTVVFWFERIGQGPPVGDPHIVLCDDTGFGVWGMHSMMRLGPPGNCVEGWSCDIWPRRERYFTVRVYESMGQWGEAKPIGEFKVRNPVYRKYPLWAAEAFPTTKRNGDLSLTLLNLVADVGSGSMRHERARNPVRSRARADFYIRENDRLTKEWGIISAESSDATGNLIDRSGGSGQDDDIEVAELQPHPWPAEAAWKLRVGVSRKSNFGAAELWTLHDMPLTATALPDGTVIQTNLQGALLAYTGQALRLQSGLQGNRHFNFRVTPGRPDYQITLVKAKDDLGREVRPENWWSSQNERTYSFNMDTNAKIMDITVALHRTRYFEFLARPRIFSTNETARR